MKRLLVSLVLLGMIGMVSLASAGTLDNAKVCLTVKSHSAKATAVCTTAKPTAFGCDFETVGSPSLLVTTGNLSTNYDVYVVVTDINPVAGLAGAAFGVGYDGAAASGVDVFAWYLCADLEFPGQGWPEAGGGNSITFVNTTNCQQTVDLTDPQGQAATVLGAFYVYAYSPDVLSLTMRNIAIPDFKVADCTAAESSPVFPNAAGRAGFGGELGHDPCFNEGTPVQHSTWGAIKKGLE